MNKKYFQVAWLLIYFFLFSCSSKNGNEKSIGTIKETQKKESDKFVSKAEKSEDKNTANTLMESTVSSTLNNSSSSTYSTSHVIPSCYKLNINLNFIDSLPPDKISNSVNELIHDLNTYAKFLRIDLCFELDTIKHNFSIKNVDQVDYFQNEYDNNSDSKVIYLSVFEQSEFNSFDPIFDYSYIKIGKIDFQNIIILMHEIFHFIWNGTSHIENDQELLPQVTLKNMSGCANIMWDNYSINGTMITRIQRTWINDHKNGRNINDDYIFSCNCIKPKKISNIFPKEFKTIYPSDENPCCEENLKFNEDECEELFEEMIEELPVELSVYLDSIFLDEIKQVVNNDLSKICELVLELNDKIKNKNAIPVPKRIPKEFSEQYRMSIIYISTYLKYNEFLNRKKKYFLEEAKILFPNNIRKQNKYVSSRTKSFEVRLGPLKRDIYNSLFKLNQEIIQKR